MKHSCTRAENHRFSSIWFMSKSTFCNKSHQENCGLSWSRLVWNVITCRPVSASTCQSRFLSGRLQDSQKGHHEHNGDRFEKRNGRAPPNQCKVSPGTLTFQESQHKFLAQLHPSQTWPHSQRQLHWIQSHTLHHMDTEIVWSDTRPASAIRGESWSGNVSCSGIKLKVQSEWCDSK